MRAFAPVMIAALLGGCIEIREEIRLDPDGTLLYTVDMAVPEFLLALQESVGNESVSEQMKLGFGVTESTGDSIRVRDFLEEDLHHFVAEQRLPSLAHFVARSADTATTGRVVQPGFELAAGRDGRVRLRRLLSAKAMESDMLASATSNLPQAPTAQEKSAMAARMMAGRYYRLAIRGPSVVSSNGNVSGHNGVAEWKYPMAVIASDSALVLEAEISGAK